MVARTSDGDTGLIFRAVPEGGYERGKTARNEVEADLIAQAALKHAQEHPDLSLGIGTFSVAQRDCIRDQIDDLSRKHPELDTLIRPKEGREPLFVKNLENIQGDERDVIFISVGYGRDANGKLTQNFGPVGREGGERRLNVLITRARKRCEVFSSIVAEDIKLDSVGKPGIRALKEFLKLAKDGYAAIAMKTDHGFDSPFEEAVAVAIRQLGYDVQPQVGMAGFFIDLAVIDPRDDGRYLMGIECDGAAYHSSRYSRDRDRLRQAILESRGWKIHRIWSTDWFYKPERETQKLKEVIERALSNLPFADLDTLPENFASEAIPIAPKELAVQSAGSDELIGRISKRLPQYRLANFNVHFKPILPQELSVDQLAYWTTKIVAIEQPIHSDEVARRLAICCGKQKAGRQIQEATLKGLIAAKRKGELIEDGDFWSLASGDEPSPRDRSHLESSDTVRKPALIAPSEYEAAGIFALQQNLALEREELLVEIARLLGFARIGPDIRMVIESVIDQRLTKKTEQDHLGRFRIAES